MLNYIYQALFCFRKVFSRKSTWLIFCMVVFGFIGSHEMQGVTSLCRFWGVGLGGYHMFLHFFRASSWSLEALIGAWSEFLVTQNQIVYSDGRVVLFGDHTNVAKDGRRMPCVVTMHQHSETQSKPSYFRGHCWGAIGMLIGSLKNPFCIPLDLGIHLGLAHVGEKDEEEKSKETLGKRIVKMAMDFAERHDRPSILTLDAFFS